MSPKNLLYRREILKQLYFANKLSCAGISERIKKSIPVTTRMLNELIKEGAVLETGHAPSTGGRRPVMFSLNAESHYVVAVAVEQLAVNIVIANLKNRFVTPVQKINLAIADSNGAWGIIATAINDLIKYSGIKKASIAGIGIGMSACVIEQKNLAGSQLKTGFKTISSAVEDLTEIPTFIDHDSSLIALAEMHFGAARNKKNALVINVGLGIGLGLILNGVLFRGHNGYAGELSHLPLFANGKLCVCGKSGCLETEASLTVVAEKARVGLKAGKVSSIIKLPKELEGAVEAILAAAVRGDTFSIELLSESAYHIGRGASILIHILNPEVIVLSGQGALAGKVLQAPIQQAINEHCIPRLADKTVIDISSLGNHAKLVGAAALVMENYESAETKVKII